MKIAIGSDHAGFAYKIALAEYVKSLGHTILDLGTFSTDRVDYPDFAVGVGNSVASKESNMGILVCGSGIGVCITANKVQHIRAATCVTPEMAHLARAHNDANIVCIGERLVDVETAKEIVYTFLNEQFDGGRHSARVEKIHSLTQC